MPDQLALFAPDWSPLPDEWHTPNRAICVPGLEDRCEWGCLMVDAPPNEALLGVSTQCFPFLVYDRDQSPHINISNAAVADWSRAIDCDVDALGLFYSIYGQLHRQDYRERWRNNLTKELPRVPVPDTGPDYRRLAEAGEALADLHCGYEGVRPWPLTVESVDDEPVGEDDLRLTARRMRYADDDRTAILIGQRVRVCGVPPAAQNYSVCGRTPLDWVMRYYHVHTDPDSGLVNDANAALRRPRDILTVLGQAITTAVDSASIIERLNA